MYPIREATKKVSFFSGPATKRGGGKGLATKKYNFFLKLEEKKKKARKGWGLGKALMAVPLRRDLFLRLP